MQYLKNILSVNVMRGDANTGMPCGIPFRAAKKKVYGHPLPDSDLYDRSYEE